MDQQEIRRRLWLVGYGPEDAAKLASIKKTVSDSAHSLASEFFQALHDMGAETGFDRDPELALRASDLKAHHIQAMVSGNYDESYVAERMEIGRLYSEAKVDSRAFLGAYRALLRAIGLRIMNEPLGDPENRFDIFMAFEKIAFFDLGLIMHSLTIENQRTILRQQEAIRRLSTPVLTLSDRLLVLPIVGHVDENRASEITEALLRAIQQQRARAVVIDITGVPEVDIDVALHLTNAVRQAALMGAKAVVTGLSADLARSLSAHGEGLERLEAYGSLRDGVDAVRYEIIG